LAKRRGSIFFLLFGGDALRAAPRSGAAPTLVHAPPPLLFVFLLVFFCARAHAHTARTMFVLLIYRQGAVHDCNRLVVCLFLATSRARRAAAAVAAKACGARDCLDGGRDQGGEKASMPAYADRSLQATLLLGRFFLRGSSGASSTRRRAHAQLA
jgi:hypothetical protein